MLNNVFLKTFRDNRKSFLFWAIGTSALIILTVLFFPQVSDIPELSEIFDKESAINLLEKAKLAQQMEDSNRLNELKSEFNTLKKKLG